MCSYLLSSSFSSSHEKNSFQQKNSKLTLSRPINLAVFERYHPFPRSSSSFLWGQTHNSETMKRKKKENSRYSLICADNSIRLERERKKKWIAVGSSIKTGGIIEGLPSDLCVCVRACAGEGWFGTGCRNAALVSTILARKKETLFSDIIKAVAGGFWHAERRIEEINDTPDSIHLTERRPVRRDGTKNPCLFVFTGFSSCL